MKKNIHKRGRRSATIPTFALANSMEQLCYAVADGADYRIAIENAGEIDADGWALIAPFGEHPKSRLVRTPDGGIAKQDFIQALDNESAQALLSKENGVFRKLRRFIVGIPVYADATGEKSHPDLANYQPENAAAKKMTASPAGVVDNIRIGARGLEAHFTLTPEGAMAVENGAKYPSAHWLVKLIETLANGAMRVRPFQLLSVGLTPFPNISGVDSLANAKTNQPAAQSTQVKNKVMKELMIGWLLANSVAIANSASESEVFNAFQAEWVKRGGAITALTNSKTENEGKITSLETEKTTLTGKVSALENDKTTLTGKVTALENDVTKQRKARIENLVDLVVTQGRLAIAERAGKITALENCKTEEEFAAEEKKLREAAPTFKVANDRAQTGARGKETAGEQKSAHDQLIALANSDPRYREIKNFQDAWNKVCTDHPALVEQLKQAPAAK